MLFEKTNKKVRGWKVQCYQLHIINQSDQLSTNRSLIETVLDLFLLGEPDSCESSYSKSVFQSQV